MIRRSSASLNYVIDTWLKTVINVRSDVAVHFIGIRAFVIEICPFLHLICNLVLWYLWISRPQIINSD